MGDRSRCYSVVAPLLPQPQASSGLDRGRSGPILCCLLIDGAVKQAYGHRELSPFQGRDLALSGCVRVCLSSQPFGDNFG